MGGYVDTSFGRVNITRIHLEEDTATLKHEIVNGKKVSLIDFNRSGTPLAEIVTEPDIHSAEQAKELLKKIRDIVRAIGDSDADMDKGQMRLEANISLSPDGKLPNYKVEVKNINSFRYFANSLTTEFARHAEILDKGETPPKKPGVTAQTLVPRFHSEPKKKPPTTATFPTQTSPIIISDAWLAQIKSRLVELPSSKIDSLLTLGIVESAAKIIVGNQVMMDYIEQVKTIDTKMVVQVAKDLVNKKLII